MTSCENRNFQYAIIGGGIAGVSCVEQILEIEPEAQILLISCSPVVKQVSNVTRLGKTLQDFIVIERSLKSFRDVNQSVVVLHDTVISIQPEEHILGTKSNGDYYYKKLCLCSGGVPKVVFPGLEQVIGIRDTESVEDLTKRLTLARRVLLIGNGGIATELVYELEGVNIIWSVKDSSISAQYMDSGAAEFFIQSKLEKQNADSSSDTATHSLSNVKAQKRMKYSLADMNLGSSGSTEKESHMGSALGPDWHEGFLLKGTQREKRVTIVYETECKQILTREEYLQLLTTNSDTTAEGDWPIYGELTNGKIYGCDLVISATGVRPNCDWLPSSVKTDPEKGILVNCRMESEVDDIYAAGDICYPNWKWSPYWFHMRLWTQARQQGLLAGKWMVDSLQSSTETTKYEADDEPEFTFELFSHVTKFFGFKVVLLGLFNAQGLVKEKCEYLVRCTKGLEYIKVVLQDHRMKGAILIGETGLEETFENLILNQLDLSPFGEDLLNPDIDIEDYFD